MAKTWFFLNTPSQNTKLSLLHSKMVCFLQGVQNFFKYIFVFSFVSLKSVKHLECHKASKSVKGIQWESMCVSKVFERYFKGVLRMFQGSLKGV